MDRDTSYWGPELEFFIFRRRGDSIKRAVRVVLHRLHRGGVEQPAATRSRTWATSALQGGYFPVPPHDSMQDLRSEMILR